MFVHGPGPGGRVVVVPSQEHRTLVSWEFADIVGRRLRLREKWCVVDGLSLAAATMLLDCRQRAEAPVGLESEPIGAFGVKVLG